MKKILLLAVLLLSVVSCYDDSKLWESIEDHELRISELEKLCTEMNTNIASLKTIVTALQNNDYVTGVTPIIENGKEVGYTIEFAKAESITIYHGKDGADGQDGSTPVIGVRQDSDGRYYWTLNGEWLLDESGNKIPTTGADGKDGITPQLKIEDKYWYISYDNGANWHQLGKATGEDGTPGVNGDSFFQSVTQDNEFVHFTLADGTVISIPKRISLAIEFDSDDLIVMQTNSSRDIRYTVTSILPDVEVEVISSADIKAKVISDDSYSGVIRVKTGDTIDEYSKVVVLVSNGEKVIMKTLEFEASAIEVIDEARVIGSAEGGVVGLTYLSNMECEVFIPEEAKSWISVAPDTRAMKKQTITLMLEPNEGYRRSATVIVQSYDGALELEYQVEQSGGLEIRTEREALIALYKATGGDNWINNTNWCTDAPVSSWYGITTGGELGLSDYADNVIEIALDNNNLTGAITSELAAFSQLKGLFVQWNSISGIDISHNYNLESLACFRSNITELDTDNNPKLRDVNCSESPICELNLSNNSQLVFLDCFHCDLKELDVSNLTQLKYLYCNENPITSLIGLNDNINLEWLYCHAMGLSSLDISKCPKLTELSCWGNDLKVLDVSNNRELYLLWCGSTNISELDLSNNPKLKSFDCLGNFISTIDFSNNNLLEYIGVGSNLLRELDVSCCPKLATLNCSGNPELSVVYIDGTHYFADFKDPFTVFIDKNTGEIIDSLHYISSDYSQDRAVTILQTATKGDGIDIVLMGDAYSDRQIADGTYRADMERLYNNLFTEEPYKSFKDHFNVCYVNVVSATEGYEYDDTALDTYFTIGSTLVGGNDSAVFNYALNAISEEEMDEALLIVAMNSDIYAGTCYMYSPETLTSTYGSGLSVAYFPKGDDEAIFAQLLHHEACGHGFAKLGDEYAYASNGAIPDSEMSMYMEHQNEWGWWKNVDFTGDSAQVRWSYFLEDERYQYEGLGCFEGGLTYWRNVWRPTEDSIMNSNRGGFNAPSREAIYYRIHKLAFGDSWEYDYEEFVSWDAINRASSSEDGATARRKRANYVERTFESTASPVIMNKSWRDAK